jgi:tetratricopeptide (TPR) repeat protein
MMMRRCAFLVLLGCVLCAAAHPQTPAAGTVHPSVTVLAGPSNSYALYLPSAYSAVKRWPLLLVFDPFGRGETAVRLFHDAAEKYGFIVVGSNNSRNFQDPSTAIRLLWADVKERYAIDPRRIYTAGLSGGARVASSIALACKSCIAGVIANGAGLPQGGSPPQGASQPGTEATDWFLVAGTTDFNYPELLRLKEALDANAVANRFVVYDGPHNWMPPEFAESALAWLQLRAMAKGLAPADRNFIDKQFERRTGEAQAAKAGGDPQAAVREYREIANDFRAWRDVKEQEAAAKSLAGSEDFRKARKNEKAALELADEVAEKLGNLVAGINQASSDDRASFVSRLNGAVNDTYRDQRQRRDLAGKQAISRGLASAFAYAAETGQQAMLKKDYFAAREMFQAGEIIQPESAWASYLLATAYAEMGEKKPALQELKKALDKGMTNPKALEDSAFDKMRNDAAFQQIVEKLRSAGKQSL